MLNISILCVGKLKERFYTEAAAEYVKRLGGYCRLNLAELPEERLPERPSRAQIDAALVREGEALLQRIPKGALAVALCVEGRLLSSEDLARRMSDWMLEGRSSVVFLIGGSYGLAPSQPPTRKKCRMAPDFTASTIWSARARTAPWAKPVVRVVPPLMPDSCRRLA